MPFSHWIEFTLFIFLILTLTPLLGTYMAQVFTGKKTCLHPLLYWLEKFSYKFAGIQPSFEMSWRTYGKALLFFNVWGVLFLFILQLTQHQLPLNPQKFSSLPWPLAFNTAVSFVTNTNWQAYAGETTMSALTQMLGLTSQNFLSAATGMSAFLALTRGLVSKSSETIGNFWVDLVRTVVYLLLPLAIFMSLFLISQGVIQNLSSYNEVTTLESAKQVIPLGPTASQVAIKQLGTNGGGFFNANSAHPFENPNALSNFFELLALILIPAASVYTYGLLTDSKTHSWLLFLAMSLLWIGGFSISFYSENLNNPVMHAAPLLEGKETRIGILNSILWSTSTTASANGSVNSMLSSLTPLAGGICLFNIMIGELIFGGVGVGLLSLIMLVLLTVFLSGLMVGRTPEYLGKKIERWEMQWVMMAILTPTALILIGAGLSCLHPVPLSGRIHEGPHGLSELLYAFTSSAGNNGSAFAGLNANTDYFNVTLGLVMLISRAAILLPTLAIAGLLAKKKITPPSLGTFSTNSTLFLILLLSVILVVSALTFFPALSLGPIMEHLLMLEGSTF